MGPHYVNINIMKMNSLHYVLMAGIDSAPSSGYDLTLWLANLGRHFWAAEHSSIYPALHQLQAAGFLAYREQPGKKGQTRKIYRLSARGRKELRKWVDEPSGDAQVLDEQMVKVLCFDLLPRHRIVEHLNRIKEHHAAKLFFYEDSLERHSDSKHKGKTPRLGPLLTLRRGILAARGYVQWCDEAISLVTSL
jgi:DNA-binding PadR family transcriptional regulator